MMKCRACGLTVLVVGLIGLATSSLDAATRKVHAPVVPTRVVPTRAYRVAAVSGGLVSENHRQRFATRFDARGIEVQAGAATLRLQFRGYGHGADLGGAWASTPSVSADTVVYRRGHLNEWYVNRPGGLEQSFMVAAPPAGPRGGWLTLAFTVTSRMRAHAFGRDNEVRFGQAGRGFVYRGIAATDARGRRLTARIELRGRRLMLRVDDRAARYPVRIDPFIQSASTSDPYAQAVLADQPAVYLRLDEPGGRFAFDSSGNGQDGTYEPGIAYGTAGPLVSNSTDTAVTWSGGANAPITAVTQSGAALPSGNGARTVEFWWRLRSNCNAEPAMTYGGSGSNSEFEVALAACSTNNGTSGGLNLLTGGPNGQKFAWPLPANWADGSWHLFDVTYDGSVATGYMDGQVVGESAVSTPLSTLVPGNGLSISDQQTNSCCSTDDIAEAAVYPAALSPAGISAHWTAAASTSGPCLAAPTDPYGQSVVSDGPSAYLRLTDLVSNAADRVAFDSSGHCTPAAPNNGAFMTGVAAQRSGALLGVQGGAVTWAGGANAPITAVTQSDATFPSGNKPRTVEFWWRLRSNCNAEPTVTYGGPGTNNEFEVGLAACSGNNGTSAGLNLLTGGQTFTWPLPANWADGSWHLFDVAYDGTSATGYMDGQVVGSSVVPTALTTATPGSGLRISDDQTNSCCSSDDIEEVAVYPTSLSPARIDAHWSAGASTAGPCAAAPTDPYGKGIVSDTPSLYMRLGELLGDPNARVAFDSSGHCTAAAPTNGAFMTGTAAQPDGALPGYSGAAVTWTGGANAPITAVTQSAATLPSGNAARTVEFWWRLRTNCNSEPTVTYGGPGTNNEFEVGLAACSGNNGTGSGLNLLTGGQTFTWPLPTNWTDGNWHMFDVSYDGTTAIAYMDGQVVGSSTVPTALTTVTPGNGMSVSDDQTNSCCSSDDIAEVAVYPAALSPGRINAHWEAQFATPPGTSIIDGSALQGGGGGIAGARAQACPTSGAACIVDAHPTTSSGTFHMLVPNDTYTVTIFPPTGSSSGPQTITNVTVPPNALDLTATFSPPGGLPGGVTFSSPGAGTQQNVVPRVNWGAPSTVTATGQCKGGFGAIGVSGVNTSTGQLETRSAPMTESPAGSGNYTGTLPPLAPIHGLGDALGAVVCPGHTSVLPSGGPESGGTTVALGGSGFTGAAAVSFGSTPAASFQVLQDDLIEAVSPAGTGSVPVTVTAADGHQISVGSYSYYGVTGLSATSGPSSGGTSVAIHGTGFNHVTGVVFGTMPASSVTVVSPTEVDAVAPPGVGKVDVQVINGLAASQPVTADYFAYQGGPASASNLVEPTGPAATFTLADDLSNDCANAQDSQQYVNIGQGQLCRGANFIMNNFGPGGALQSALITGALVGAAGLAIAVVAPEALAALAPVVVAAAPVVVAAATLYLIWKLFIDPSGTVVDTTGNPINGATATLLVQPPGGASFSPADPNSGSIEPATNPETTGSSGAFDWDALAGTYQVEASAPGCHVPGNAAQPNVFTSAFQIPPPAVGLLLTLECPGSIPPSPTISGIDAGAGPSGGGNTVDIIGTGLAGATGVRFGGTPASQIKVLSAYAVAAVAPAGSGTVDVTVTTDGGTSATSDADKYSYAAPASGPGAPAISGVAPASGPLSGGTRVTITGSNLDGAYAVDFGGTAASRITDVSSTEVQAVAPAAQFPARVDISVTTSAGTSAPVAADAFTYGSPPAAPVPTMTLTASPNPAVFPQSVTLSATVSPTDGGGTVAFYDDGSGTPLGGCATQSLTRSAGTYQATCSAAGLSPGGHTITAVYSGDSSYASAAATTGVSIIGVPVNLSAPSLAGITTEGQPLTETHGGWTNAPTSYSYQWQDCDSTGGGCADIPGATAQSYTLGASDVGHTVRVEELATNAAGTSSPASSPATAVVAARSGPAAPPANSIPPTISGPAAVGQRLMASTGAWSGTAPMSFAYQWQICRVACTPIGGATASSYNLIAADLGASLRVEVIASNSAGSAAADSQRVGPIGPSAASVKAALAKVLAPSGTAARISSLLRAGGYPFSFAAPSAGRLMISWYFLPRGAHLAKAAPVLVASARATARRAGKMKSRIRLTGQGRLLLERSRQVKLTATASFTPAGGSRVSGRRTFTLAH